MYNVECKNCGITFDLDKGERCPDCRFHYDRNQHFDHFDTQIQPEELQRQEEHEALMQQANEIGAAFNEHGEAVPRPRRTPTRRTRRQAPPPPVEEPEEDDDVLDTIDPDDEEDEEDIW